MLQRLQVSLNLAEQVLLQCLFLVLTEKRIHRELSLGVVEYGSERGSVLSQVLDLKLWLRTKFGEQQLLKHLSLV